MPIFVIIKTLNFHLKLCSMFQFLKKSSSILLAISLTITSCSSSVYSTKTYAIPGSRTTLDSYYNCLVKALPSTFDTSLEVYFSKVTEYEVQEEKKVIKHTDHSGTRLGGICTMLVGSLTGALVAIGGTDEDGNYSEPDPELGRGIIVGSLVVGGLFALIPNSKSEVSSSINSQKHKRHEAAKDTLYSVWSSVYPDRIIQKKTVNREVKLDVITDLGLDYIENTDSVKVYFKSNQDETLVYTVDFLASNYLKQYLNTKEINNKIPLHQAPTASSPIMGNLSEGDNLELLETRGRWYRVLWNGKKVYLASERIGYFFAKE